MFKYPTRKAYWADWNQQGVTEEPRLTVAEARDLAATFERGAPEHQPVWDKLLFSLQSEYVQQHFRT